MERKPPSNPDTTLPPHNPTMTQEFKAVTREDLEDPNKTNPNIRVGPFPKPSERPPVSPPKTWTEADLEKINRTIAALGKPYEYGGIKLHDVKFLPNGDLAGTDENGVRFIVPSDEVHMFHGDEQE